MNRYSTLKKVITFFPVILFFLACDFTSPLKAQGITEFDYIKKKGPVYYAVLELSNGEYLVIGTRNIIYKNMKIERSYGRIGEIGLSILGSNGKQTYIRGRIMDNGRNTTFYSKSSARQFVRRLVE